MSRHSIADDGLFRKLALAIGFLAVAGSALAARAAPATGYEISIYAMTPGRVWAGLLVAMAVALAVSFVPLVNDRRRSRSLAVVLGGLTMVVFAGLPIIRGYRFVGQYDALTHLGWARAISEGTISPFDLFYPAIHTATVLINSVVGVPLSRAMQFVVLLSTGVFCAFVPLCVGTIVEDRRATVIAAFAAFLLLPVTTISTFLSAHSMTQAIFFSALLLFVFTKYLRTNRTNAVLSATGVAFALGALAAVVYHPQLVAHLIAAFLGICAVQFLARRVAPRGRIADQTTVYSPTLLLIGLFLIWSADYGFFSGMIGHFLGSAIEFVLGGGSTAGDTVAAQGTSLSAIGASLLEVFLKLFAAHLVFSLLAAGLVVGVALARNSDWRNRIAPEMAYFTVALIALVPVFGAYVFAPGSSMYFRVFGLMMVFVTILGAIAIHGLSGRLAGGRDGRSAVTVASGSIVAVGFAALLVLSLAAVVPSPYTYNPSPHVSDTTMSGYETAFEHRDDEIDFVGLRDGPNRYDDAVNGNEERSWRHLDASAAELRGGLRGQYEEDRYFALTRIDYDRELIAYQGLRYTESELDSVESERGVHRVQSNGEFELYYVPSDTEAAA